MNMTNKEIIEKYKLENNIPLNKPLLSFLEWNKKGYKVKAGEKAHIKIMLWKKIKKTTTENGKEIDISFYVNRLTSLFTMEQVEKKVK